MSEPNPMETKSVAGTSFSFRAVMKSAPSPAVNPTVGTGIMEFERIKHLVSNKPLRGKRPRERGKP